MTIEETKLHHGGLMRCCIKTLTDIPDGTEVTEGQVVPCKWCSSSGMVLRDGAWHWRGLKEDL